MSHVVLLTALLESISGYIVSVRIWQLLANFACIKYTVRTQDTNPVIIIYVYAYLLVVTMCIMHAWRYVYQLVALSWTCNHDHLMVYKSLWLLHHITI